jgi:RNA polymerase sigma factor (sigma-70 family)
MSTDWDGWSDAELWEQSGDVPEAFGALFQRHVQRVYAFLARRTADLTLAEDLTSIVFLQAWNRRRGIRLDNDSALPWLLGIATNVVRNSRRSVRRYHAALDRLPDWLHAEDHAERVAERVDAERALSAAMVELGRLNSGERDVVALVWWSDLTYEQAAQALGLPLGTVRSRLSRARTKLRAGLALRHPQITEEIR